MTISINKKKYNSIMVVQIEWKKMNCYAQRRWLLDIQPWYETVKISSKCYRLTLTQAFSMSFTRIAIAIHKQKIMKHTSHNGNSDGFGWVLVHWTTEIYKYNDNHLVVSYHKDICTVYTTANVLEYLLTQYHTHAQCIHKNHFVSIFRAQFSYV